MKDTKEAIYKFGLYPLVWILGISVYTYFSDNQYGMWLDISGWGTLFWICIAGLSLIGAMLDIDDVKNEMSAALLLQSVVFIVLSMFFYLLPRIFIFEHYDEVRTPSKVKVYQLGSKYHMDAVVDGNKTVTFYFPQAEAQRLAKMTDVSKFTITTEHRYNGFMVAKWYKTDSDYSQKVNEVVLSEIK